jgi:hypothetical protein
MSLSRRHFVHLASLSWLAGAVLPSAFGQQEPETEDETFSPENLAIFDGVSRKTFEYYLGDRFAISFNGKSLGKLTLIAVTDTHPGDTKQTPQTAGGAPQPAKVALTGFSLIFQGSGGRLPQETYMLSQAGLGKFPLLLVPCDPKVSPPTYEAVFTMFAGPAPK